MSSDCPACTTAAEQLSHEFRADCRGCAARAAARSPHFHRVAAAGVLDRAYRNLLEQFGLQHDDVKAAAAVDQLSKDGA